MADAPLLELDHLSTHYIAGGGTRVIRAVDEVSLRINAGETLEASSASPVPARSTLALTLLRTVLPAAGARSSADGMLQAEGEDLVQKSEAEMREVRGKRIAMILQDPMASLNPLFSIGNQVAEPIRVHEGWLTRKSAPGTGRATCSRRCASPLPRRGPISIRMKCRAGCASASSAPSAFPASRAC